jgi:4-amino-4-deoxy-L-arabinose transferase-like glycosyltransferase
LVGAAVAALVTLPGLGLGTLWDNSETAYGEVAREILLTHNWVVMHLDGRPWFIQPPLYFWLAGAFAALLGPTSLAMRLPSALATIAMGAATGYAVARQVGERAGAYAAVVLSCSLMQAVVGRLAIMDALLNAAVTMAIFWCFEALETGRSRYAIYAAIAAALGFLAKGPVAPVVVALVIVPFAIWNRRHERMAALPWWSWGAAALAFGAIILPWLAGLAQQSGSHAFAILLGKYTIGRYTGVIEDQSGPFWYYVPVLILGFFPWIAFLPAAARAGIDELRDAAALPERGRLLRLAFCWSVVPFVFFSFARTKLPNYIALEFPALAVVVALWFDAVARKGGTRAAAISAATVPFAVGLLAIAGSMFARDNRLSIDVHLVAPGLLGMALAVFAGSLAAAVMFGRSDAARFAPYALGGSVVVAFLALAFFALPQAEAYKPVPRLAAVIEREREPGDAVAIQRFSGSNALLFYTRPVVHVLAPSENLVPLKGESPREIICASPRAWVIAPKDRPPDDVAPERTRTVVAQDGRAALYLYSGPPCK